MQVVLLEIPLNYIHGKECSPSSDQLHAMAGNGNLYSNTAIMYKAQQLKDSY